MIIATPEDGIEVTGKGSQAFPYRIKNLRGDALNRVLALDTDTVDLTFTAMAPGDPNGTYSLQADATISMSELTDVDHTDVPASGDVPTWDGTKWVFQAPATAPVGAVSTANGIQGDGSPGSPVAAKTSGVWGTAPLDIYGSISTDGRTVYIDSAGQLRTRPDTIPAGSGKTNASLPTTYPFGPSVLALGQAEVTSGGWPAVGGGTATVLTIRRRSDGWSHQLYFWATTVPGGQQIKIRNGSETAWGEWRVLYDARAGDTTFTGSVSATLSNAINGTVTISWPAGLFATAPIILATARTGTRILAWVSAYTANGATLSFTTVSGVAATATFFIDWIANGS